MLWSMFGPLYHQMLNMSDLSNSDIYFSYWNTLLVNKCLSCTLDHLVPKNHLVPWKNTWKFQACSINM